MGIRANAKIQAGFIMPFAGATPPAGWLDCAGQAVSRATYGALFLAIGTAHGVGDGSSTFNLPDLRGRAVFGKDNQGGTAANRLTSGGGGVAGTTLGATGGGETVTLSTATMPSHAHNTATASNTPLTYAGASIAGNAAGGVPVANTGGGGAHQNIPPALVANYMIKF